MLEDTNTPQLQEYFLNSGYIYVPQAPTLISTVLGSCVSVCLWDRRLEYGGMNHFLYPSTRNPRQATARYGNVATGVLIRLFVEEGSRKEDLEAQIFGGAFALDGSPKVQEVSEQNVAVAKDILRKNGISVVSEDTGGVKGRKLVFNTLANEVAVIRVERLRESDWYPYEGSRNRGGNEKD